MYEDYWNRVNELIKQQGKTQQLLSKELGFNERRINNLSAGGRSPDVEESVKIANALGVTVEYLVTGEKTEPELKLDQIRDILS